MKVFLATNSRGVARAELDTHGEWQVTKLLPELRVTCLAVNPLNPAVIYAGTQGQGVMRSDDVGKSWRFVGMQGHIVKSLAVSPHDPGTVYAGTKPALMFVSHDGGMHWTELTTFRKIFSRHFWFSPAEPPFTAYVQAIALSPTDPDIIVVGIEFGAVVRTVDGGKTWTDHRRGALRDCHTMTFHATNGDWVYEAGGTGAGAAFSRDGGEKWTQPKAGLDRHYGWAGAADPARPELWYISASPSASKAHSLDNAQAYIFRATDKGGWEKLSNDLPQPLNHMPYALLTDPVAPGHVYAGLSNGDVWHSGDCGQTWRKLPFHLKSIHRTLIML